MSHAPTNASQLLAQNYFGEWDRLARLLEYVPYELVILSGVALLVIATIIWQIIAQRRRRDFLYNSEPRLFAQLCRAHKLSRSDRRLLKHLAAARDLKSSVTLFVEPEYFEMANVPPALRASATELRQLRRKLFD